MIISVGYRVNSTTATKFRRWATETLKEYIIKGFVLDDERLKQGPKFGKDYYDELLERIREIRASVGYSWSYCCRTYCRKSRLNKTSDGFNYLEKFSKR